LPQGSALKRFDLAFDLDQQRLSLIVYSFAWSVLLNEVLGLEKLPFKRTNGT
jgi:hypothetical protein